MKVILIYATLFLSFLAAFSCTKSGGNTPVPPPTDTTVVTAPKDTSTTPPNDTTATPPQDTTRAGGAPDSIPYTNVLVGVLNGGATDAASDSTIITLSTPGVVYVLLQSWGGPLVATGELHAKTPMTVTTSGSQQFGTWPDVKQLTDAKQVQWSDTIHPYVKIVNKDKKENLYGVFVKNASNTSGSVTFRGTTASNENYDAVLKRNVFAAPTYTHN